MQDIKANTPIGFENMASGKEHNKATPKDDKINDFNNREENSQITESEGTVALADNFYEENNTATKLHMETHEFKEILESNPLEDIDSYIDNIGNRFNKAKDMIINKDVNNTALNNPNSENTVRNNMSIINNNNNIILEDMRKKLISRFLFT